MFKRILAVLLAACVAAVALGACQTSDEIAKPATLDVQTNLNGKWQGEANGAIFLAEVNADHIRVNLKLRDTDGLYWAGSFKSLVDAPQTIESAGDTAVLKGSMFGSLDKTKSFSYKDDAIKFTFGIAGTTTDVEMTKVTN